VCLPYPKMSKQHAHFLRDGDVYSLVDTSTNGSYVDGERLTPLTAHRLPDDCIIYFGKYETRFMMPAVFRKHLEDLLALIRAGAG
jgi:predicted component of type VI protein secretion system